LEELKKLLCQHQQRYPQLEPVDLVKLIYQNEFGVGHFIGDEGASLARLEEELARSEVDIPPGELFEPIGGGLVRLQLPALGDTLPATTANRFFLLTANRQKGSMTSFEEKLAILQELYPTEDLQSFLADYKQAGYPPISHSPRYKEHYTPSYRVVSSTFAQFFPVFKQIEQLLAAGRPRVLVAIDGRSSAGKSFLGQLLKDVYECPVIAMDHFFLRPEQRTPSRLSAPGGNIDYERFQFEVVPNLKANQPFSYQMYHCQQNSFTASPTIASHRLMIVEGSYSHHPTLAENYDLKVFLTVSPEIQKGRILKRNGPLMLKRFVEEWIPLEERYISALDVSRKSDLILDTGA